MAAEMCAAQTWWFSVAVSHLRQISFWKTKMNNTGLFCALVAFPLTNGLNPFPSTAFVSDVEIHNAHRPATRWPCKCQLRLPIGRMLTVSSWKLT